MIRKIISVMALCALVTVLNGCTSTIQNYYLDILKNQQAAGAKAYASAQETAARKAAEKENAELDASRKAMQKIADACAANSAPADKDGHITQCRAIELLAGKWHGSLCNGERVFDIDIVGVAPSLTDIWAFKGRGKVFFTKQNNGITTPVIVRLTKATGFVHVAPLHPHFESVYDTIHLDLAHTSEGDGLVLPGVTNCSITLMPESKQPALPTVGIDQVMYELGHSQPDNSGWFSSDQGAELWLWYANSHAGDDADKRFNIANRFFGFARGEVAVGKNGNTYYKLAFENYSKVAKVSQHTGAQLALANMYLKGLGTPKDAREAKRWFDLATPTVTQARAVCRADLARRTVAQVLSGMSNDTARTVLQTVEPARIGRQIPGTERALTRIELPDLRTTADRFTCRYRYADARSAQIDTDAIADEEPNYFFISSDEEVEQFERDKDTSLMIASAANFLNRGLAARQYVDLTASPTGAGHYTLSVVPPFGFLHIGQGNLDPVLVDVSKSARMTSK